MTWSDIFCVCGNLMFLDREIENQKCMICINKEDE